MGNKITLREWMLLGGIVLQIIGALTVLLIAVRFLLAVISAAIAQPAAPEDDFGIVLRPMEQFITANKPYPVEHVLLPSEVYQHNEVQNQAETPPKTMAAIGLDAESLRWITEHADKFKEHGVAIVLQIAPESNEEKSNLSALQKILDGYPIMPAIPAVLRHYGVRKVPCLVTKDGRIFE